MTLASNKDEPIQGMRHQEQGDMIQPDASLQDVDPDAFDTLLIPG